MLNNIDLATKDDLIRVLSAESIDYYNNTELGEGWPSFPKFNHTKFVRLGVGEVGKIILGSQVDYGPEYVDQDTELTVRKFLYHKDLRRYAQYEANITDEEINEIRESVGDRRALTGDGLMLDAGTADIGVNAHGVPFINFSNKSYDFGQADASGRQETVETARLKLGSGFFIAAVM